MSGPETVAADLLGELDSAVHRVHKRGYIAGWRYGVLCGLVAGACSSALFMLLINLAASAWAGPGC